MKLVFAVLVSAAMLLPVGGAFRVDMVDSSTLDPALAGLPIDFGCDNGITEASFPDPFNPELTKSVSITCPGTDAFDSHRGTDCPGDSYSAWSSTQVGAWTYTYATSNPFGFSQTTVAAAWDNANEVFDAQVTTNLFNGHVFGGSGSKVGTGDGVNQAGFKAMSGSLRNAIAVQYAWTSGGKMVETDSGYNTNYPYSTSGASDAYDLQSLAAQEMGHGFGLGHSDTSTASKCLSMYPYGTLGATWGRTLGDGDISSIKARYA